MATVGQMIYQLNKVVDQQKWGRYEKTLIKDLGHLTFQGKDVSKCTPQQEKALFILYKQVFKEQQ